MIAALAEEFPVEVERYIGRFVARWRLQRLLRAAARAVLFTLVWVLTWCLIDRFAASSEPVRLTALALNIATVAGILARPLRTLLRPVDAVTAAGEIEVREPRWSERLRTVASRMRDGAGDRAGGCSSRELLAELSRQVADEARDRDPATLLPWRPVLRPAAACVAWVALVWVLSSSSWLGLPTLARRYFMPMHDIAPVTTTRLSVQPGHAEVTQGDPLRVAAWAVRLGGGRPPSLHVRPAGESSHAGAWHVEPMTAMPDGTFEGQIARVDRDLEYFLTGGDARTQRFTVTMLPRPAVKRFHMRYLYPPHAALPPREVENETGAIEAPAGSEVTIAVETTEPLDYAVLTIGAESNRITPASTRPTHVVTSFTVNTDIRYTLRMVSDRGVSGVFRGGSIRAIPDRAPVVQIRADAGRRAVGGGDVLPLTYQAVDDYGLARLDVEVRVIRRSGAEANASLPVPLTPGIRQQQGMFPLSLRRFGLDAGDEVELRLHAEDRAGQFASTSPLRLPVTSSAPPGTQPSDELAPAAQVSGAPPPPASPPFDPPGYGDALRAYFDAIRGGSQRTSGR